MVKTDTAFKEEFRAEFCECFFCRFECIKLRHKTLVRCVFIRFTRCTDCLCVIECDRITDRIDHVINEFRVCGFRIIQCLFLGRIDLTLLCRSQIIISLLRRLDCVCTLQRYRFANLINQEFCFVDISENNKPCFCIIQCIYRFFKYIRSCFVVHLCIDAVDLPDLIRLIKCDTIVNNVCDCLVKRCSSAETFKHLFRFEESARIGDHVLLFWSQRVECFACCQDCRLIIKCKPVINRHVELVDHIEDFQRFFCRFKICIRFNKCLCIRIQRIICFACVCDCCAAGIIDRHLNLTDQRINRCRLVFNGVDSDSVITRCFHRRKRCCRLHVEIMAVLCNLQLCAFRKRPYIFDIRKKCYGFAVCGSNSFRKCRIQRVADFGFRRSPVCLERNTVGNRGAEVKYFSVQLPAVEDIVFLCERRNFSFRNTLACIEREDFFLFSFILEGHCDESDPVQLVNHIFLDEFRNCRCPDCILIQTVAFT